MPAERKEKIKAAIAEAAALDDPGTHHNVSALSGDRSDTHRLRIGSYRAIFRLVNDEEPKLLEVLQVGPRGDVYK